MSTGHGPTTDELTAILTARVFPFTEPAANLAVRPMARARPTPPATVTVDPAALPAELAFVVQLRADVTRTGIVRGRIEHVVSGAAASFESAEQLVERMRDAIAERSRSGGRRGARSGRP